MATHFQHRRLAWVWALTLLGAFGIAHAADEASIALLDRAEVEMVRIRSHIQNASVRLEKGTVGMSSGSASGSQPDTPGTRCCGKNLQYIWGAIEKLQGIFSELGTCYEGGDFLAGPASLPLAREDLARLATAVDVFAKVPERPRTQAAMAAMTRDYLHLRETVDVLEACPAVSPVSEGDRNDDVEQGGKKSKKKKKKEKRSAESG